MMLVLVLQPESPPNLGQIERADINPILTGESLEPPLEQAAGFRYRGCCDETSYSERLLQHAPDTVTDAGGQKLVCKWNAVAEARNAWTCLGNSAIGPIAIADV